MTADYQSPCGKVRLICGDCREWLPRLEAVDAVVTDPPYGIGTWSATGGNSISHIEADAINGWDKSVPKDLLIRLSELAPVVVMFGGNYFMHILPQCRAPLVWDKGIRGMHFADGEMAWTNFTWGTLRILNFALTSGDTKNNKLHPTQKPIRVMEWVLEQSRVAGDSLVFDPFMGSGTTGIACLRTGRRFVGIEISPDYYQIAKERIQRELSQGTLPFAPEPRPVQSELLK